MAAKVVVATCREHECQIKKLNSKDHQIASLLNLPRWTLIQKISSGKPWLADT